MFIYLFIFALLVIAVFIESFGDKLSATIILIFSILIILLISANREGIGTDFFTYREIYYDVILRNEYNVELGFVLLNYFSSYFGGFKIVLFLTTAINLGFIVFILNKLKLNLSMGVLTYFSLFFLNHNFNTVRHGVMCVLVWVAFYFFYERKKIKNTVFFVLAASFHSLGLVFIPLQFITLKNINLKLSAVFLVLFFIIGELTTNMVQFINIYASVYTNRLDYYLNDYYGEEVSRYKFGLGFFLYVIVYFLIHKFRNHFDNKQQIVFFNKMLFLGISIILIFASISIFTERIANLLLISLVFIFASINKLKVANNLRFVILIILIFIDLFYFYKIMNLPGITRELQFLPYTYTFFN